MPLAMCLPILVDKVIAITMTTTIAMDKTNPAAVSFEERLFPSWTFTVRRDSRLV